MAVIVQYIVVRNGEQKMTFTSKKEADAYDKLLDISDQMYTFIESAKLDIDADKLDKLAFFMAENREAAVGLLRGGKPAKKTAVAGKGTNEEKKRGSSGRKSSKGKGASAPAVSLVANGE